MHWPSVLKELRSNFSAKLLSLKSESLLHRVCSSSHGGTDIEVCKEDQKRVVGIDFIDSIPAPDTCQVSTRLN